MLRIVSVVATTVVLSITGIFTSPALATAEPAHTWQVQAGSVPILDAAGPRGAGNQFYPGHIAIHQGDSIKFSPFGPHTVTFNRPPVPVFAMFMPFGGTTLADPGQSLNSGFIGAGPGTFTVTFASTLPAGRYEFICSLHLGMSETVDVMPAGAELQRTDADWSAIAQREMTHDLATVERVNAAAAEDLQDEGNPTVQIGAGTRRVTNLRFYPSAITIHKGQTITFLKTEDPTEPHTVTFGDALIPGDPLSEFRASGGSTYDGTGVANSGFLSTDEQFAFYHLAGLGLPVAVTKYSLTFTSIGDWNYICAIHDEAGMRGVVHVVP